MHKHFNKTQQNTKTKPGGHLTTGWKCYNRAETHSKTMPGKKKTRFGLTRVVLVDKKT